MDIIHTFHIVKNIILAKLIRSKKIISIIFSIYLLIYLISNLGFYFLNNNKNFNSKILSYVKSKTENQIQFDHKIKLSLDIFYNIEAELHNLNYLDNSFGTIILKIDLLRLLFKKVHIDGGTIKNANIVYDTSKNSNNTQTNFNIMIDHFNLENVKIDMIKEKHTIKIAYANVSAEKYFAHIDGYGKFDQDEFNLDVNLYTKRGVQLSINHIRFKKGKIYGRAFHINKRIHVDLVLKNINTEKLQINSGATQPITKLPEFKIPIETLKNNDINIMLNFDNSVIANIPLDGKIQFVKDKEKIISKQSNLKIAEQPLKLKTSFNVNNTELSVESNADNIYSDDIFILQDKPKLIQDAKFNFHLYLKSHGQSLHSQVSNAKGKIKINSNEGIFNGDLTKASDGIFMTIAKSTFYNRQKQTKYSCAVFNMNFIDGKLFAKKSIALESKKINITASGELRLIPLELDFKISPTPKSGISLEDISFAKIVKIKGNISNPKVSLDPIGVASTGASIAGSIMSGGITTITGKVLDKITKDIEPCKTADKF